MTGGFPISFDYVVSVIIRNEEDGHQIRIKKKADVGFTVMLKKVCPRAQQHDRGHE